MKRNNKNGFTLVELIAVIAIIGVVATIAVLSFTSISKRTKEKEYEAVVGSIKPSALEFYNATSISRFYVQTLIDYGLLSADNNGLITNPINDEEMNCYIIYISDTNYRIEPNKDCSKDLYDFTRPIVSYCNGDEYNEDIWHNHTSLCLKASLSDAFKDYEINEVIWGNTNDGNFVVNSPQLELNFDRDTIAEETYTVKLVLDDNSITVAQKNIPFKNDLKKPIINSFNVSPSGNKKYNSTDVMYNISASDIKSGVKYLCFTEKNDSASCEWIEAEDNSLISSYHINKIEGSGELFTSYAFAKDEAGNISDSYKNEYKLYKLCDEVKYVDGTKCSSACNGTYNRLAYDLHIENTRCPNKDKISGGSNCGLGDCTYTITYNANGGKNAPATGTKTKGIDYRIPDKVPTRSGYTFDSWNTDEYGTGTEYKKGDLYKTDANLTLYAQWTCTMEYRCSTDGNYQSKCIKDTSWTNTGETCTKNCSVGNCSKECGGGTATKICYYEKNGHTSDNITSSISCNTNACVSTQYNCKVRGNTIINTVRYNNYNTSWRWNHDNSKVAIANDGHHIHYDEYDHETAYVHYCCLKDTNGNTLTDREYCFMRDEKSDINKYSYICTCSPYTNGWVIINDIQWVKDKKGSKFKDEMLGSKYEDCR